MRIWVRRLSPIWVFSVLFLHAEGLLAGERFSTLHELLRHFDVAFVDRANLSALALGALRGLKTVAPEAEIQVLAPSNVFLVKAMGKTVTVSAGAIQDFKQLEESLASAGNLVLQAGLAKDRKVLERAMMRQLVLSCGDPWSAFLESSLYDRLLDDGSAATGDVGILFENDDSGGLRVLDAPSGTPAFLAGIRSGMKVDSVAGRSAVTLSELEALALTRGKVGEKVEMVVAGKTYPLTFAPEPKRSVEIETPPGGIARVHLLNFRAGTGKRLAELMPKIESHYQGKLKGLVLDLRGNPGGLVTEGTEVTGLFVPAGKVVSVKGKKQMRVEVEENRTAGRYQKLPLVLLMDHRSASVSEIVALALRDYGRAKLVGAKSLGKGTVQVVIELMDGSALKLSTGRYYSPNGTPIYEGIEPDVEVDWNGTGEDPQLKQALKLLGG